MPYPIDKKLVVGISTNALFNLEKEKEIFEKDGLEAFKKYQEENRKVILEKGLAFPFIRRLLGINKIFSDQKPVEVVILSKNSPETGLRAFYSINQYGLEISRAAFTSGQSPFGYIPAFNISLFLSTDDSDVRKAIEHKLPAGLILNTHIHDNEEDTELRVAFDFDGVLADDSAEQIFQSSGNINEYFEHEKNLSEKPLDAGLLLDFLKKLSFFQKQENKMKEKDPNYKKVLKTAIITARNAPAHERAVNTLKSWDVNVDEMFFLGGIEKRRILEILKPHLYIDDQVSHLNLTLHDIPLVHLPFGTINTQNNI